MKINYKTADGKIIELEVSDDVGNFYLESIDAEKKNNHRNWVCQGICAFAL